MIYLDNAATTIEKAPGVTEAVIHAITAMGNAARGVHGPSLSAARMVYHARETAAGLFGADAPEHVVFTHNATDALNIAISGLIPDNSDVITTQMEHNSVLRPLYRLEDQGRIRLFTAPADSQARLDMKALEDLITPDTSAIVCTHASNLTGNVNDAAAIGRLARKHGLLFILDASQTAGSLPVHMGQMNIDALCFSGHKGLMGPQGTGCLCLRDGVLPLPRNLGGSGIHSYDRSMPESLPERLEAGTLNTHGIAGLKAAMEFIMKTGIDTIMEREKALTMLFYDQVSSIPGVKVYGDPSGTLHTPVIALNIWDLDSAEVADVLSVEYDIAVRPGAHCAPLMHKALGTTDRGAVRFSFSWYTSEDDIMAAAAAVRSIAEEYAE